MGRHGAVLRPADDTLDASALLGGRNRVAQRRHVLEGRAGLDAHPSLAFQAIKCSPPRTATGTHALRLGVRGLREKADPRVSAGRECGDQHKGT